MLTNAAVKAAGARSRAYKLCDERGLFLFVTPAGSKSWRMKYRYQRREQLLTFGLWPEISLAAARTRCDQVRGQLERGEDPRRGREESAANDSAATFESEARDWHAQRAARWSIVHAADVLTSLERDVFPAIGAKLIADIDAAELLELLQAVEARGCIETARRLRQRISAVFVRAKRRKLVQDNPAAELGAELAPRPPAEHHPALLELEQLHELLEAVSAAKGAGLVKSAHLFLALTAVRLGALRGARWDEVEDLDGDAPIWRVPAARMKLAKVKKDTAAFDHMVPLSRAAATVLRAARLVSGAGDLIFPGGGKEGEIGEGAIGELLARAGYRGRHVPHGWRSSFSTVMNERYPGDRAAIDQALAHAGGDKVELAYNRAQHLARRRDIFERWAQLLTDRAAGDPD